MRIQNAIKEIEQANNSVMFTNRLVNDNLEHAVDQFYTLIEALYFQEIKNVYGEIEVKENAKEEGGDDKKEKKEKKEKKGKKDKKDKKKKDDE